ncbi:hypothetical protein RI129_005505 [Pyrocoelia pectoralis]|uniref:C2H2-type domain-containing protein n=1 Tax=Pyrocoelia pectoralis TaxID=417401 RepID=A0AAN7VKZ3_9COLE
MAIQPSTGCVVKLFGDNQTINIPEVDDGMSNINKHVNGQDINLEYLLNSHQADSTSQVIQLTEQQALSLGIISNPSKLEKTSKTPYATTLVKNVENKRDDILVLNPLGSSENPIEITTDGQLLHSTQNLSPEHLQQIAQALQFSVKREEQKDILENAPPNIFYRIMYPDELNLKPFPAKPVKRGRKKKQAVTEEKLNIKEAEEPPKVTKGFRTRSGRVTRPPQHIKNDFTKIDTTEGDSMDMDELRTIDFESPSQTESSVTFQEDRLESHKRKRSISSQFRCPQCKKAYLGNNKMLRHFEKHPDHKPASDYYKARYDDTWNYLIDISNKNPAGQRGLKFCQELISLLNNIRVVAKSLFKNPTGLDKNLFFVDGMLSNVLGIDSGNYVLNESKLHKEVVLLHPCSNNADNNLQLDTDFSLKTLDSQKEENISFRQKCAQYEIQNKTDCADVNNVEPIHFNSNHNFNLNCDINSKPFNTDLNPFNEPFQVMKEKTSGNVITHQSGHDKKIHTDISLHNELLSDNLLLNSLPNLRSSVEELILNNVNNGQDSVLLDNSTSSDEVMNVDQFVNERLKNLTESDLELPNTLDLPTLDLFQFHTS